MKIALASPAFPTSIEHGLQQLDALSNEAAKQGAKIICFPESYIPGYPVEEFNAEKSTAENMDNALASACAIAKKNNIAIILPMDWFEGNEKLNVAYVIAPSGKALGYQSKNQLDPSEDNLWIAGTKRQLFEIDDLKFGITICHEGFRYPESVRWAAIHGAHIVFHPHFTGSNISGVQLTEYRNRNNPYYEQAAMMRAMENTIYFASINYASTFQESASAVIAPDGSCVAYQKYGQVGVIIADINQQLATAKLAKRYKHEFYANAYQL